MHEKGFYEMRLTMEFSAGVKKIKTFLKKLLFFFKKAVIFKGDKTKCDKLSYSA